MLIPLIVAASLIACPDCGHHVSHRAFMCPGCGCAGDVIRSETQAALKSAPTGSVLRVDSGRRMGKAFAVEMREGKYAVLALDDMIGADRVELFDEKRRVEWTITEVAVDAPIARFRVSDTNLVYSAAEHILPLRSALPNEPIEVAVDGHDWRVIQPREWKHLKILADLRNGKPADLPYRTHPYFRYLEQVWNKETEE